MLKSHLLSLLNSERLETNSKGLHIVSFGEVIAVVNNAVPPEDIDLSPDVEVCRAIKLLLDHAHAGIVSMNGLLR